MRVWIALVSLAACAADEPASLEGAAAPPEIAAAPTRLEIGARYLASRGFRRDGLVDSLVDPSNGYSELRLRNYAVDGGWDDRPPWNPPARPITTADLGGGSSGAALAPFDLDVEWSEEALIELGARAFEGYPLSLRPELELALASPAAAASYGLWTDDRGRVGGALRVDLGGGDEGLASTCATCHARVDGGALVHGAGSATVDVGRLRGDYYGIPELAAWGPGQVDTTVDVASDPIGIPDLRPLRHQRHLNAAATIDNSFLALVIRVETLMITSGESRPPRLIPLAVAMYLWSLGESRPAPPLSQAAAHGRELYAAGCAGCHGARHRPGDAIAAAAVGTDPVAAASPMRGTGDRYRVPSLFRASDRRRLLHLDGVASLEELLDPARLEATPGHAYGTELDAADRADLIAFLETL